MTLCPPYDQDPDSPPSYLSSLKGGGGGGGAESRDNLHVSQLLGHNQPVVAHQCLSRGPNAALSILREGNVSSPCVTSVKGPLRLSVADEKKTWSRHCEISFW